MGSVVPPKSQDGLDTLVQSALVLGELELLRQLLAIKAAKS